MRKMLALEKVIEIPVGAGTGWTVGGDGYSLANTELSAKLNEIFDSPQKTGILLASIQSTTPGYKYDLNGTAGIIKVGEGIYYRSLSTMFGSLNVDFLAPTNGLFTERAEVNEIPVPCVLTIYRLGE